MAKKRAVKTPPPRSQTSSRLPLFVLVVGLFCFVPVVVLVSLPKLSSSSPSSANQSNPLDTARGSQTAATPSLVQTWTPQPTSTAYKSATPHIDVTFTAKSALNVRSGPGTGYQILDTLKTGDTGSVIGQNNGWLNIQKGDLAGWITSDNTLVDTTGDISQVAEVDAPPTRVPVSNPGGNQPQPTNPASAPTQQPGQVSTNPQPTAKPQPTAVTCPGFQYNCSQLTCAQAYACLKAGKSSLDGDGDGVPCENVCPGG